MLRSADCVVVIVAKTVLYVVVVTLADILTDGTVLDCFVGE